jgi:hypothetical protein
MKQASQNKKQKKNNWLFIPIVLPFFSLSHYKYKNKGSVDSENPGFSVPRQLRAGPFHLEEFFFYRK